MALPSQTERQTEIGRSYVYKDRGATAASGLKVVVIAAASLVLVAGSIWAVMTISGRNNATGTLDARGRADAAATTSPNALTGGVQGVESLPATAAIASVTPGVNTDGRPAGVDVTRSDLSPAPAVAPQTLPAATNPATTPSTTTLTPASTTVPATSPATTPATTPATSPATSPATNPATTPTTTPSATTPGVAPATLTPGGQPGAGQPTPPSSIPSPNPGSAAAPGTLTPAASTSEVVQAIQDAERKASSGDVLAARVLLNRALRHPDAVRDDQERIRQRLMAINQDLVFSSKITPGDPLAEEYSVKSGDNLIRITRGRELAVDWRLIERINNLKDKPLRIGQKIKLVRGPFHAIVRKSEYRLDLFHGSPDDPDSWQFIRSFRVGLGTGNSTPPGTFVVRPRSKLVNPHWVNPQTGQRFHADDPKNPIGEYWLGLQGIGDSKTITGYGIHGTIEPDSIGQQKSMGCVRLGDDDVRLIYELLVEQISVVKIVP